MKKLHVKNNLKPIIYSFILLSIMLLGFVVAITINSIVLPPKPVNSTSEPTSTLSLLDIQQVDRTHWYVYCQSSWHNVTWSPLDPDANSSKLYIDSKGILTIGGAYAKTSASFKGNTTELILYLNGTMPIYTFKGGLPNE